VGVRVGVAVFVGVGVFLGVAVFVGVDFFLGVAVAVGFFVVFFGAPESPAKARGPEVNPIPAAKNNIKKEPKANRLTMMIVSLNI
jgi:hypothetical protein